MYVYVYVYLCLYVYVYVCICVCMSEIKSALHTTTKAGIRGAVPGPEIETQQREVSQLGMQSWID